MRARSARARRSRRPPRRGSSTTVGSELGLEFGVRVRGVRARVQEQSAASARSSTTVGAARGPARRYVTVESCGCTYLRIRGCGLGLWLGLESCGCTYLRIRVRVRVIVRVGELRVHVPADQGAGDGVG